MKVWDITLSCDHKMLVIAPDWGAAIRAAARESIPHGETPESAVEVNLDEPGLLAWYPGQYSKDAIIDEEYEPPFDNPWDSAFAGGPYSGGRNL